MIAADGGPMLGPCLVEGMGEPGLIAALNAWGAARDREVREMKASLTATQVGVFDAFDQAKEALLTIVGDFRGEAEMLRQQDQYEAAQSIARLEQVVTQARLRFDAQDSRFTEGLNALAQRLQAVDAWAQAEPTRVAAAVVQAWPTSPGGTPLTYYVPPAPGMRPAPSTPPRAAGPWLQPPGAAQAAAQTAAPAQDPWAAYAAQPTPAAPGGQSPHTLPGGQRHFDMSTPSGGGGKGGFPYQMRIDLRSWGSQKLDVGTSSESFQVWKDRAMMFLSRERPDVRKLLTWAETQSKDDLEADLAEQAGRFGIADLGAVEYAIHDAIKAIIQDSLLGRARNCVERGCELWRSLCAEWSGAAPQLKHAKARRYQEPARCKDISELWSRLPAWERLGEEVKLAGLDLPEWLRSAALEKLLPTQLLGTMIARPELASYAARVTWVKTQMEHARGLAQASAYGPSVGKDTSGDVHMGSLEMSPGAAYSESGEGLVWALQQEKGRHEQLGDWGQAESLQVAIQALSKGKGKGGGFKGKGGSKGKSGGAQAEGNAEFNGVCHHCGIWGHRRSDCRRLDTEMSKGKGKGGGKGGKGGPKGGKGPILECAEEAYEDTLGAEEPDGVTGEEWYFDGVIGSVAHEVHGCRGGRNPPPPPVAAAAVSARSRFEQPQQQQRQHMPLRNRFAALSMLVDDAELLGAVSAGAVRGGKIVEAVVDSGAVHSVAPPLRFPGPMSSSPWSRAGRGYRAANGTGIKNLGQVQVAFGTTEGHKCQIPFQVAEVEQPLLSVAHLTAAGNRVELGATDGRIINISTGRTIALEKRGGVYLLKMFVADAPLPFRRQGA